ncbi:hypothetical protein F5Y12DRAFT_797928 [Xylaria sp. FL1777]|nr:hypothetical protein F5Y12DRAFT_797928 [Xylaria sp. FL1777]
MDPDRVMRPRPGRVNTLPVELLQMILEFLPDVTSLHAAVSCSLFYHGFLNAEKTITTRVLMNQIDFNEVLPEAIMSSESALLPRFGPENLEAGSGHELISGFVARNLQQRAIPPRQWSLRRALRVSRLHFYVDALAKKFVDAAFTKAPLNQSSHPVTHQEICRIQRALYRFETYCNLFWVGRKLGRQFSADLSPIYDEQRALFFAHFHPCETEQLGCIHDFLVQAISPAPIEIVGHDILWGVCNVEYIDYSLPSPYSQYFLSLGVKKLYGISSTEGHKEWYRGLDDNNLLKLRNNFLFEALLQYDNVPTDVSLDEMTREDEKSHIKQPFFDDPDPGPVDAWRWAHWKDIRANWVYQEYHEELREWGYVIWDRSRLETVGIFRQDYEEYEETSVRCKLLLDNREARKQFYYLQNS